MRKGGNYHRERRQLPKKRGSNYYEERKQLTTKAEAMPIEKEGNYQWKRRQLYYERRQFRNYVSEKAFANAV